MDKIKIRKDALIAEIKNNRANHRAIFIDKDDTIITAFAEPASGPGWGNSPIWVIVRDRYHNLRQEVIQPKDQTPEMLSHYHISMAAHYSMRGAVMAWLEKQKS